jgi:hypothetical protein
MIEENIAQPFLVAGQAARQLLIAPPPELESGANR